MKNRTKKKHPVKNYSPGILYPLSTILLLSSSCQVLTYSNPQGDRFTSSSLGSKTSIHSLTIETDTNGFCLVQLQGYANDSSQALGALAGGALRIALQGAK